MSVYVDDTFAVGDWGKWTGGGHLQADTADELHAFATRLGLKRSWFQSKPGRPEYDHYDLTRNKRDLALKLGAIDEGFEAARNAELQAEFEAYLDLGATEEQARRDAAAGALWEHRRSRAGLPEAWSKWGDALPDEIADVRAEVNAVVDAYKQAAGHRSTEG